MGLETHAIVEIKERFHKEGNAMPHMNWEYGCLLYTSDAADE